MLITPEFTFLDGRLKTGLGIETADGKVKRIFETQASGDQSPFLFMPGCHDLQVNGGGGVMLNGSPTADALRTMQKAHASLGTTAILPTVITDTAEVIDAAADAAIEVKGEAGQLGLHIEGPHLAIERRGTHKPEFIRPLNETTVRTVERLRHAGVTVVLTLAPELADRDLMGRMVAAGAILAAGHSAATAAQAREGLDNGISCFTHIYNAMPPMLSRAPGILAAALLSEGYCGLIADGIHVDWDMVRIALAARPKAGLTYLVSDAMATVGGPDHFVLYGQKIFVRDGALVNAEGSLAGAHIDMVTSIANLHRKADVPLETAIAMATDVPRAAIGLKPQRIGAGAALADFITLDEHLKYAPLEAA
ncbi:N-acetylglucosamine-6-phosphate deacetylase [Marivivens aquimaris]|uniref:N-acetylglucosamine-6-phosphate deacetylase n=1 Tax=Marivivens aquimaris TaxID=2774876 RepID=UPI001880F4ED|nr:N-acetylglucosamine-6-phosphate deacetylase [Marivivens aquimaris]